MKPSWTSPETCRLCLEAYEDEADTGFICIAYGSPCQACNNRPDCSTVKKRACGTGMRLMQEAKVFLPRPICKDFEEGPCHLRVPLNLGNLYDTSNLDGF